MTSEGALEKERSSFANQAVLREVNAQIRRLTLAWSVEATYICECQSLACTEPLTLTDSEYARVRALPEVFAMRPGHQAADMEVTYRNGAFVIARTPEGSPHE